MKVGSGWLVLLGVDVIFVADLVAYGVVVTVDVAPAAAAAFAAVAAVAAVTSRQI